MRLSIVAFAMLTLTAMVAVGGAFEGTVVDLAPTAAAQEVCKHVAGGRYVCFWCPDLVCDFPWD